MPGIYGTPSPLTFSLISLNVEQLDNGRHSIIRRIIFFITYAYIFSIFAAQYLNSGIFPYGSKAGLVKRLAADSL